MIVCFVDIGGTDDHHCLNFLFIEKFRYQHCRYLLHCCIVSFNWPSV